MTTFLLVLIDCAWKKFLIRCLAHMPWISKTMQEHAKKRTKLNRKQLNRLQKIYGEQELELKQAASNVVKAKLNDGQYRLMRKL